MRKSEESVISSMAGFVLSVVFGGLVLASATNGFEYSEQAKWYEKYPKCAGNQQSPIHLSTAYSTPFVCQTELKFINYRQKYNAPVMIKNNNHTVDIIIPTAGKVGGLYARNWLTYDGNLPKITGGPLGNDVYVAEAIHFHWGVVNKQGSEHVVDGVRGSLEMHILHRNIKYASVEEAKRHKGGVTVLGVNFIAAPGNPVVTGLLPITNNLNKARKFGSSFDIKDVFSLGKILENLNLGHYFTYKGSLTTPPCFETVDWIFFKKPLAISIQQMSEFRKIENSSGKPVGHNFRQLQPINNRPVYLRIPQINRPWFKVVNDL